MPADTIRTVCIVKMKRSPFTGAAEYAVPLRGDHLLKRSVS